MHGRRVRLSWLTKLVVDARHSKETRLERFYRRTQEALDREIPRSEQIRLNWTIKRHESSNYRFYYVHVPVGINCFVAFVRDGIWGWRIAGHRTPNVPTEITHIMYLIRNGKMMRKVAEVISYHPVYNNTDKISYGGFGNYTIVPPFLYNK